MGKNLIPIIVKELGVEIGEEFETTMFAGKFRFYSDELQTTYKNEEVLIWVPSNALVLKFLISGKCKIVKLPFEPKPFERYWTYMDTFEVDCGTWHGYADDYCLKAAGCVFRTKEEALAARPAKYKELTGKEWEE